MWVVAFVFGLHIVSVPYDHGANIVGSRNGPGVLVPKLKQCLRVEEVYDIGTSAHLRTVLGNAYMKCWDILDCEQFPLLIGGDHTVAISGIFASNAYANLYSKRMGVLWIDAHADFNTMESSESKNLHGVPVAVLCGHTLPILTFSSPLDTSQIAYYGIRDVDDLEQERMEEYNMIVLNKTCISQWCQQFDVIHISFDVDCVDPSDLSSVNTPVSNGPLKTDIMDIMNIIKQTNKLISMDIVEFNPKRGDLNASSDTIVDILSSIL